MSELEQTIEELEAEVLAELEEGQHAKSDPQMKGAAPAEGQKKLDKKTPGGEVEDGGLPWLTPKLSPHQQMLQQKVQQRLVVTHNRKARNLRNL